MIKATTVLSMLLLCLTALAACQTTAPFETIVLPEAPAAQAEPAQAPSLQEECALYEGTGITPARCGG